VIGRLEANAAAPVVVPAPVTRRGSAVWPRLRAMAQAAVWWVLSIGLVVAAWEAAAALGLINPIILPPPHYQSYQCLGIGPGTPKAPPYTHDIADGVTPAGYRQGPVFAPQQFSNGQGVWLAYMVVPTSTSPYVGSSPDFASGPVIPNSLFPINVNGVTRHNSAMYDPNLAAFSVPAITDPCVVPAFNVDGYSHFPIFLADNADFGPPNTRLPGRYVYSVTMTDSAGNGWRISATFVLQ